MVVLDAGQFSTRCRCCGWRSGLSSALTAALAAFQSHPCPVRTIGLFTEPAETPRHRQVDSIAAPGWPDELRVPARDGGEAEVLVDAGVGLRPLRAPPGLAPAASPFWPVCPGRAGGRELPC